jgi:hypothetical protein
MQRNQIYQQQDMPRLVVNPPKEDGIFVSRLQQDHPIPAKKSSMIPKEMASISMLLQFTSVQCTASFQATTCRKLDENQI